MIKRLSPAEHSKKWRRENPEKVKAYRKKYQEEHREELLLRSNEANNKMRDSGLSEEVFERDNWTCQECGMSLEQSFILFNKRLCIHHLDGNGEESNVPNNNMDNLTTLCQRCHGRYHKNLQFKEKWGDLIKQDDSEWKYPKIRYLVEAEIKKGLGVQKAKRRVSEKTGMCFSSIDHRYYMKKNKHKTSYKA